MYIGNRDQIIYHWNIVIIFIGILSSGPSEISHKSSKRVILDNKSDAPNAMQAATSVPLLSVDTVVTVSGNDNALSKSNKSTATTTLTARQSFRKIHKSGGDDEGDGVKGVTFQKPPYFRTPSRRSLQLIRGPSRYNHRIS